MKTIETPLDPMEIKKLRVNDTFKLTGTLFTARDSAHKTLLEMHEKGEKIPISLADFPCFHCGPITRKVGAEWKAVSAGPTTSIRMEIFEEKFMEKFGVKVFIGKGGMGERTLRALEKFGAVYTQFTGGAGSLAAESIKAVKDVFLLDELGIPEAVWVFEVEEFGPLLVTMDSHGSSLHEEISKKVSENLERLKEKI